MKHWSNFPSLDSGWTCDRFNQKNTVEMTLCDFRGFIVKGDAASALSPRIVHTWVFNLPGKKSISNEAAGL